MGLDYFVIPVPCGFNYKSKGWTMAQVSEITVTCYSWNEWAVTHFIHSPANKQLNKSYVKMKIKR